MMELPKENKRFKTKPEKPNDQRKPNDQNRKPGQRPGLARGGRNRGMMDENYVTATQRKKDKKKLAKKAAEEQLLLDQAAAEAAANDITTIYIGKSISVKDLADAMGKGVQDVMLPLMKRGIMATINQEIEYYTAAQIAEEFDILVEEKEEEDILAEAFESEEVNDDELKVERPPVVVVMGHVDHGKTSLLDAIRSSQVMDTEAGGITQHIGAYQAKADDKVVTFLDTPGHEAFTAMRMRGAKVTDIAILVVAADDGVMPQTIEAISHAKAADIEIIVAINKIDKPGANPDRVKQELSEHGLVAEDWGGNTICVPVSAKQRMGLDDLLANVLIVAELKELKANPDRPAKATVIEANLDKSRGSVATVLIQEGTLKVGDPIVVGATAGKVRQMLDHKGNKLKTAGPSTPVEITGLTDVPKAGDMMYVAKSVTEATNLASKMATQGRDLIMKNSAPKISLDDLFNQIQEGNMKELNLIVKADVQGSVEAVRNSLERLTNDEVRIRIIHGGVGQVTENDVMLASTSSAIIIGFNVSVSNTAQSIADEQKVDVRSYRVIYNAIEDITAAMTGMLDPVYEEKIIGKAVVRQMFKASGVAIAGSYVLEGKISRNAKVRISRGGKLIHEGEIDALKRFKDDVKEVATGYEFGISFVKYNDVMEEDTIEAYIMEEVKR